MIERAHLAILKALHEQGSLAAASQALNLTQSALTHSIRKLESHLDTQIWVKEGRGVRLTQAGEYLLEISLRILPQMEHADQTLKAFGEGRMGKLRIGMECHPCYQWLMGVVSPFLTRWPKVDLDVIQQFRFNGAEALAERKIDVLITSDPLVGEEFGRQSVLDYELLLVSAKDHPLALKQEDNGNASLPWVNPSDIENQNLITFPVEKIRLDVFTYFLTPAYVEPKSHRTVETIEVMLQLVASGRGVCTLPNWLVAKYQSEYAIEGMSLGQEGVNKTLYLVYRKSDQQIDYIQDFIQLGANARK